MKTKAVLLELFELLETYAPAWYSEEQRDRAIAALNYTDKAGLRLVKPRPANQPSRASAEPPSLLQRPSSLIQ
jgi:hypothetical protein